MKGELNMKNYTNPAITIVSLNQNDIVRTSALVNRGSGAGREYSIDDLMK